MYLVFSVFHFYSGVGRAHLAPSFATPLAVKSSFKQYRLEEGHVGKEEIC